MDRRPTRRTRSTGPSRPGAGTRAGRPTSTRSSRSGTTRPLPESDTSEVVDTPSVDVDSNPALAAADREAPTGSLFSRGRRRSSSGPAGTRPGTAPSAAATVGVRRISAKGASAPKVARTKSQLVRQVVVLALVFFAVAFAVAVPLRNYLSQRAELAATVSHEQELRAQLAGLQARQQALADPAFIMSQAMRRLQ